ncbi:Protein kinase domain-containing protein [Caenorhabditis elegans]|uniref:Protein kinase domain-containing protein n=1 Tax=Caenorhabditis elegans TaxID=6239 RepID=Q9XX60_CAEEL|nr:Protein kinase domain-containing protein [Caenorhabditis elegans]CAA20977.2 Protein kinase domain-containing protein [Caenorhabditis elegans]|eukprot:NP_492668.2 Uncharacterized protein CELE_Y106G6D.4 [Caenorhabditis elegans]
MNEDENKGIVFQIAYELPSQQRVGMQMANLRLHARGVFSNVYRGTILSPGTEQEIAIKKTWPKTPYRNFELLFLSGLRRKPHKNIVQMLFAFSRNTTSGEGLEMKHSFCESYVFGFMPYTLQNILKKTRLAEVDMKLYTWQLFEGIRYLQAHMIVHRDIKPVNILVDVDKGTLKIADFGSAKVVLRGSSSTSYQVTRFYRPPELLLDAKEYYWMVDVWSAGCCVGEMMKGKVLFPGASIKIMLKLIVQAIGLPSARDLDYMKVSSMIDQQSAVKVIGLKEVLGTENQEWADFLGAILRYRPRERLHGPKLLSHPFFDLIFTPKCTLSNGLLVSQVITLDDYKTAQKNDSTSGKQYAAAILRHEIRFSLKAPIVHPPAPPAPPVVPSKESKESKETKEVKVSKEPSKLELTKLPSAENQTNVTSPTAVMSLKRTLNV